ncbi:MAG: hypothetical protein IPJ40_20270 [Saprospirales bacterium]|nr:hypothetical protein [Saprospirales bacterium]
MKTTTLFFFSLNEHSAQRQVQAGVLTIWNIPPPVSICRYRPFPASSIEEMTDSIDDGDG